MYKYNGFKLSVVRQFYFALYEKKLSCFDFEAARKWLRVHLLLLIALFFSILLRSSNDLCITHLTSYINTQTHTHSNAKKQWVFVIGVSAKVSLAPQFFFYSDIYSGKPFSSIIRW